MTTGTGLTIDQDGSFSLDGIQFVIDVPPSRPSEAGSFSIAKSEPYLRFYEALSRTPRPTGVLELGIFQGGSFVFLDKLLTPRQIAAVDIATAPVEPLIDYASNRPGRFLHFGTDQADESALRRIVEHELQGELDLVIDDASHRYDLTKRSFEILYPLLRGGGLYVIEDWAWAHLPSYQQQDAPFADRPALTNLLMEQLLLLGSTHSIAEISVLGFLYTIRKPIRSPELSSESIWDGILSRGRPLGRI
jgi:predicted O-methyltransferase YrrM